MTTHAEYHYVLFRSVSETMWADKLLKSKSVPRKLIPVPRGISSDCGVCIRLESEFVECARNELASIGEFRIIGPL